MPLFYELFGKASTVSAQAPGRVNLLGEHTDYNDGYVLPIAIPQHTVVELAASPDDQSRFYSLNLRESALYRFGAAMPPGYAAYVAGCLEVLRAAGYTLTPVQVLIHSDVPIGAGLSSSAALEVAVLRGLRELFRLNLDDVDLARLAQQAEIDYVGMRCGIMDQMASSLADGLHMLFLDTRTLEQRRLPLPDCSEIVVLDSGVPRSLIASGYNQRRQECEDAARLLGVTALRDIEDDTLALSLPAPLNRRARHVITENRRVLRAAGGVSAVEFGRLMNASHDSLRDDFEVSVPELDLLVDLLREHPAVYGARLTGAGFGGACVALARAGHSEEVSTAVLATYAAKGHEGRVLV